MTNKGKRPEPSGHSASEPCDALARMQRALSADHEYKHITHERAAELADIIAPYDDDRSSLR